MKTLSRCSTFEESEDEELLDEEAQRKAVTRRLTVRKVLTVLGILVAFLATGSLLAVCVLHELRTEGDRPVVLGEKVLGLGLAPSHAQRCRRGFAWSDLRGRCLRSAGGI
jgi:hypothetical protein